MSTTIIRNSFTGYEATIRTASDLPAISTVEKHFRKAKASDCMSHTTVEVDGVRMQIVDMGRGKEWFRTPGYLSEAEQSEMEQAEEAFYGFWAMKISKTTSITSMT